MADYLTRPNTAPADLEREEECIYEVADTGDSSMKVVVRVRPESEPELRSSCQCVVKVLDEHVLVFDPAPSSRESENRKPFGAFSSPGKLVSCNIQCCGKILTTTILPLSCHVLVNVNNELLYLCSWC